MCMLFSSLVVALNYEKSVKAEIKVPCEINEDVCSSSTHCNITIRYPNGTYIVASSVATYNHTTGDANYTLTNTEKVGEYSTRIICKDGVYNGTSTFNFKITPAGKDLTTGEGIIYIIVFFGSFVLFGLSLYGSIKIKWKDHRNEEGRVMSINDLKYVKVFLWWMNYILLIWLCFLLYGITYNFLYLDAASRFFRMVYYFLLAFFYPSIVCFLFISLVLYAQSKKLKKILSRGLLPR